MMGAGAALIGTRGLPVMAGPFEENEYLRVIPKDKRLDPAWVRSLYERGTKETCSEREALRHVGMPVGGFFAGTVYLGGDGRLWLWDIFNRDQEGIAPRTIQFKGQSVPTRSGANYLEPAEPQAPFRQGFSLRIGEGSRTLDSEGFSEVTFDGRYPIGRVSYRDPACPIAVALEAFSPFIPLNLDDSSLPATILSYTLTNTSRQPVECELTGQLENPVCLDHRGRQGLRENRIRTLNSATVLACSALPVREDAPRPDILFEDFERDDYGKWTSEGEAFGSGPVTQADVPDYQGDLGGKGSRVVNSHASAPGDGVGPKDAKTGTLTSPSFKIQRRYINLLVGGGAHRDKTCVDVLVGEKVVATVTGRNENRMSPVSLDVATHEGREARIRIVDRWSEGWGNIGVDHIVFSDTPADGVELTALRDFGTVALALLDAGEGVFASSSETAAPQPGEAPPPARSPLREKLSGKVGRRMQLEPGHSVTLDFVIAWHFPNFYKQGWGFNGARVGHHYAARFRNAEAVVAYIADNFQRLAGITRRWVETWYDSTLPWWLLDRTMANTSTLATTTCYRFEDGRFNAWEGIGCCPGTCTHVWHYAQAPGRLFPELERLEREKVNFGVGFHEDGGIGMRTHLTGSNEPADDGQCGRILGVYREHQMSPDDAFLRRLWPKVRKAMQYLIRKDGNSDGMIEGAQPNTLDAAWYGKISWLASLYLAALGACEAMAAEVGDAEFAMECRKVAGRGAGKILETFNGEYFVQIEDPRHKGAIGIGQGCEIDQMFGQTWAHWLGLGRLFDRAKQLSALRALWRYNFVPDVGPFREKFPRGRWYATAGDAGLLMCTWPRGGQDPEFKKHWQYMYFNECMSGFEYQAAAHMVWEGRDQPDLLRNGLAVTRAIHDRYNAALRNPYNEIECSDHYARAMAGYGVYQGVCGFRCHGPKGHLEFEPRLNPERFRAAFVSAEGWGTFRQEKVAGGLDASLNLHHGKLRLRSLGLQAPGGPPPGTAVVKAGDRAVPATVESDGESVKVLLETALLLSEGEELRVSVREA